MQDGKTDFSSVPPKGKQRSVQNLLMHLETQWVLEECSNRSAPSSTFTVCGTSTKTLFLCSPHGSVFTGDLGHRIEQNK